MTNEELQMQINQLRNEIDDLRYILSRKTGLGSANIKGNIVSPSSVAGTLAAGSINSSGMFGAGVVDQAAIGANAAGQSEWKYETADITIAGTNTSGTATVVSGSIPVGYFLTAFTTPAASYVKLSVSGTTLTAELSTAPGAGNSVSIRIILLKS